MNDTPDTFCVWLTQVLDALTWDAGRQLHYVHGLGVGIDELALQFDDAFHLSASKVSAGSLSSEVFDLLTRLDERFSDMTAQAGDVWSEQGLVKAPERREIRAIAVEARSKLCSSS